VGALSCPTRGDMGPRFLGVIVAALFYNLRDFELVGKESDVVINGNGPLLTSRGAYEGLRLARTHRVAE
jgi:hypothetical protein